MGRSTHVQMVISNMATTRKTEKNTLFPVTTTPHNTTQHKSRKLSRESAIDATQLQLRPSLLVRYCTTLNLTFKRDFDSLA